MFCSFEFEDYFQKDHKLPNLMEIFWVIFVFVSIEFVGNILLFATIAYEKFGMDPKKRNITNQLLSHISTAIIFSNFVNFPVLVSKWLFAFFPEKLVAWVLTSMGFFSNFISLSLFEMTLLKCFYIGKWNKMSMKDDDFFATWLGLTNFILSFLGSLQRHILDDGTCYSAYQKMTGMSLIFRETEHCQGSKIL